MTFQQDFYQGQVGNAFYQKFTPAYIIRKLKDWINKKERVDAICGELWKMGKYDVEDRNDKSKMERYFVVAENEELFYGTEIHEEGVKNILIDMNLLLQNK